MRLNEEEKTRRSIPCAPEEVPLAIGKNALNIKLASKLTGYVIDVYRDNGEDFNDDIYLDEFKDEKLTHSYRRSKEHRMRYSQKNLAMDRQSIIDKADLEEDTVDNLLSILKAEFED